MYFESNATVLVTFPDSTFEESWIGTAGEAARLFPIPVDAEEILRGEGTVDVFLPNGLWYAVYNLDDPCGVLQVYMDWVQDLVEQGIMPKIHPYTFVMDCYRRYHGESVAV